MIATVFNKKGGVGKTIVGYNIARDLGCFLISNDDSEIEKLYQNRAKIVQNLKVYKDDRRSIVYDLGGFIAPNITEILRHSDLVIIPTNLDKNSLKRTFNTVVEVNQYCSNSIIVINRINHRNFDKYKKVVDILQKLGKEIFMLRESEAFPNSIDSELGGKTITEQIQSNPLLRYTYRHVYAEYSLLLARVAKEMKHGI